jgi:hypothetical protein
VGGAVQSNVYKTRFTVISNNFFSRKIAMATKTLLVVSLVLAFTLVVPSEGEFYFKSTLWILYLFVLINEQ